MLNWTYYLSNPDTVKNYIFTDRVGEVIRINHLSYSKEKRYVDWIYRLIIFHDKKDTEEIAEKEIGEFLTDQGVKRE
jgi:hypothetical protein